MAILQVLKGAKPGTLFQVTGERTIIGRHPGCQIVLDNGAISRHHAQILESHGVYFMEDLRSRNGTYVNGIGIEKRTPLHDGDQIRICDVTAEFQLQSSIFSPEVEADSTRHSVTDGDGRATLDESQIFDVAEKYQEPEFAPVVRRIAPRRTDDSQLAVRAEVKLRAMLDITRALGGELELDSVLPKMLATLFNIFPQSDQGFVLLKDPESEKLRLRATRVRGHGAADQVAVSMTVVNYALSSGEAILSDNLLDDSRFQETSLQRMQIRSVMCVPLLDRDENGMGVIQIVTRDAERAFSEEDLDLLSNLANQAALAIENANLHGSLLKRKDLERDLEYATQIQLGFLPTSRPKIPQYTFGDHYEAALRVGGDYFDYIPLPDGRIGVAIGDVAGKGMPAALLMARLYSATRLQLFTQPSPAEAMAGLNMEVSSSGLGHRFITFLLMVLDPTKHEVTLVNAGHVAPICRNANGQVTALTRDIAGLPLGILIDQTYKAQTIPIAPGDTYLAFTDGITEAMSPKREMYGRDRVLQLIAGCPGTMDEQIDALINDAEKFSEGVANRDDTCVVGFQRAL